LLSYVKAYGIPGHKFQQGSLSTGYLVPATTLDPLSAIAQATLGTQWEGRLFLVGGAVRDELLGLSSSPHGDFDIVLESDAGALARHLYDAKVSSIPPVVYPRFGTAMVRVAGGNVELVTARRESYSVDSRKPDVEPATLLDDALRRDFTINTLLKNIHTGEIADPLGQAYADLEAKILRTPLDANETFSDDPLRMIRAVRFRARFGLTPSHGLYEAVSNNLERLRIVSSERIRDEFEKMLVGPNAADSLDDLMQTGLLSVIAPEFSEGVGIDQGSYHSKDVWGHSLDVVRKAEGGELIVMLGALFHDIGKPRTRSVEPTGRVRFFGHEDVGATMTTKILRRLKFSNDVIEGVATLVKNHMRLGSAVPFTKPAARRLKRDLGKLVEPLLALCEADAGALARIPKGIDFRAVRDRLQEVESSVENVTFDSPLSGEEIMSITGCEQGPAVGRYKRALSDAVVEGKIQPDDKDAAAALLRAMAAR
jgi:poly(A) polymerase